MTHDMQANITALVFTLMLAGIAVSAFRLGALYGRERFKADCVTVEIEETGSWPD